MQNLVPGETYYYVAKVHNHSSEEFSFIAPRDDQIPMKFLVFGDLGLEGGSDTLQQMITDEVRLFC